MYRYYKKKYQGDLLNYTIDESMLTENTIYVRTEFEFAEPWIEVSEKEWRAIEDSMKMPEREEYQPQPTEQDTINAELLLQAAGTQLLLQDVLSRIGGNQDE